jgi:CBS domain-containing protein
MIQNILDRKGTEVVTIRGTETVKSAADRMRELGIAALVVKIPDPPGAAGNDDVSRFPRRKSSQ